MTPWPVRIGIPALQRFGRKGKTSDHDEVACDHQTARELETMRVKAADQMLGFHTADPRAARQARVWLDAKGAEDVALALRVQATTTVDAAQRST